MNHEELTAIALSKLARRSMMKKAAAGVLGAATVATLGTSLVPTPAEANYTIAPGSAVPSTQTDVNILNFALNLEYLEAQYYSNAVLGVGLSANDLAGGATTVPPASPTAAVYTVPGAVPVAPGTPTLVPFATPVIAQLADTIAADEQAHVRFIKYALIANGALPVPAPLLDVTAGTATSPGAFTKLAIAANNLAVANGGQAVLPVPFNPYANENNFLLGAFVFEDVGVTAYAGAAGLLSMTNEFVQYAASILAIEAYHAGTIRTLLTLRGFGPQADAIANLRSFLSSGVIYPSVAGPGFDDAGILDTSNGAPILAPRDATALAFRRNTQQVLNIVYGNNGVGRVPNVFFPQGLNQQAGQTGFA